VRLRHPLRTGHGLVLPRTPLGTPTWLLVTRRRGRHARVLVPFAGGATAPLDLRGAALRWTSMRVRVDVRRLRLAVYRGAHLLGRFAIAAGSPATPTPVGRFTVTDRVRFAPGGPYGPFALGISARQRHLPSDWTGGDQVAIHGTDDPTSLGNRVSLGCIRVPDAALPLLRRVPLGAPVTVTG
jgi:L,D-transpeptidase catalytic domain